MWLHRQDVFITNKAESSKNKRKTENLQSSVNSCSCLTRGRGRSPEVSLPCGSRDSACGSAGRLGVCEHQRWVGLGPQAEPGPGAGAGRAGGTEGSTPPLLPHHRPPPHILLLLLLPLGSPGTHTTQFTRVHINLFLTDLHRLVFNIRIYI